AARIPTDWLDRPAAEPDPRLRKIFWGLAMLGLVLLLGLSLGSGINADDKFQVDYSQKLVNYYGTFGRDTAALNIPEGNMHLYGGAFEMATGFANKAFGYQPTDLGYHQVRHATSALLGWIAMLCAALFARLIAGERAGLITLIIMLLSPRFVGDSLMNPKDIPFAAGYMLAIYNLAAVLTRMPRPRPWNVAGLVGGLALGLAMRAGGLLTFVYVFLFAGLYFLFSYRNRIRAGTPESPSTLGRYALVIVGTVVAGYVLALLFWPFALQSPLKNPFVALSKFADLEVKIRVLYEGENMMSDKTPWHYPLKWILYTIPLAALVGFLGSVALLPRLLRKYNPLWVLLAGFAAVFPVFYIIYKHSVIHDGWRHLTFAYPPLCVVAGLFWNEAAAFFSGRKAFQYAVLGAMGLLLVDASLFIVRNPKIPYVYFNPLIGGIQGAYGQFETDYWGLSTRQGIEWLEQQGILGPNMQQQVVIATNMLYSTRQLTAKYGDKVKLRYLKWEKRCDDVWDYALYPTRFLDGATLQKGKWPPDNAVHIVEANGAPLLVVLKDNGKNCGQGIAAAKQGDYVTAIERLKAEVANVPDNDLAWANLAQSYLNNNQPEESKAAAEQALTISPDDMQAGNLLGMYWMAKNDRGKAKAQFEANLKKEPSNAAAWYYLGLIEHQDGDNQTALNDLMAAIKVAPNFKPAYELSAQIYEAQGNAAAAQQFRAAMGQMK
ncbi:MAG: tetratricopeptide repeat protein, partial [Saprospiraceae bacterium]